MNVFLDFWCVVSYVLWLVFVLMFVCFFLGLVDEYFDVCCQVQLCYLLLQDCGFCYGLCLIGGFGLVLIFEVLCGKLCELLVVIVFMGCL